MVLGPLPVNRIGNAGDSLEEFSSYLHIRAFTFFFRAWKKVVFTSAVVFFSSLCVGTTVAQYRPLWVVLDMVRGSVTEERDDTSQ